MSSLFPNRNSARTHFWRRRGQPRQIREVFSNGRYRIEQLEPRHLLTAAPLNYDTVSADWFETIAEPTFSVDSSSGSSATDVVSKVSDDVGSKDSESNSWIVRLSPSVLQTVSQVTDTVGLFSSASGLRVLGGLGLPGQLLLESSACSSEIFSYLEGLGWVSSFEQDLPISVSTFSATSSPNDPRYGDLYGLHNTGQSGGTPNADIDAPEAWSVSTGSRDVIVAVVDTGIDYNHPDLAANMWVNPGEIAGNGVDDDGNGFVDDVHGYDFVNNDGDPFDDQGHGTHCAGTIGGVGNNGTGVVGVNWEVSLMGLKFLSSSGSGSTSDAIQAINYATMMRTRYGQNVRVTSNSWGGGGSSSAMRQAIESGAAADILFVAAAGNDRSDNDSRPQYPASYTSEAVVSVAATDRNDALASFSNYGATSVDLAAPGVSIVSSVPGGGYASYSGTSMATPHVAGAAALALAVDPTLSVADLKTALLNSVDGVSGLAGKVVTGGRLNAGTLISSLSSDPTVPTAPGSISASDGTSLGGVQVAWSGSLFADDYTLYRSETANPSSARVLVSGLTSTSYLDSSAVIDSVYHYWVTASNDLGTSPLSASDSGFHAGSRSPNNAFADRFILEGRTPTASGSNVDATAEPGEPVHHGLGGGKSVWWTWTAPTSGTVEINTFGSDYDTVLAVYQGTSVDSLRRIASNDDSGSLQSQVTFTAAQGESYQIAVDGYRGASGSIALAVAQDASQLTNNAFADRFILEGRTPTASGSNVDATAEPGEPVHHGLGGGKSVWWTWTAPTSGTVEINTFGSDYDTVLAVYQGTSVDSLRRIASNDDSGSLQSQVTFTAAQGESYQIAVDGYRGASGSIALAVAQDASEPIIPIDEISLSNTTIAENSPVGTDIGMFAATGGTGALAFELIAGAGDSGNEFFEIAGNRLRTDAVLDYESEPTHSIRVRATDQAGQTSEQTFLIIVENTSEISFNYGFRHINQENAEDFLVSSSGMRKYSEWQSPPITYWGPAANDVVSEMIYHFPFDAPSESIFLKASSPTWDFGSQQGASAIDVSGNGEAWTTLHDNITPENWGTSWRVQELLPDSVLGTDGLWIRMRFLVENSGNSSYTVAQFGRSTSAATDNVFEIRATLAEASPITGVTLDPSNVVENMPAGTVVGEFSATGGSGVTYALVSGDGDIDNESFQIVGSQLVTAQLLDHESDPLKTIRVRASDATGSVLDLNFNVVVENINEAPTSLRLSNASIAEDAIVGTVVGSFSAEDEDITDTHTFALVAGEGDSGNALFTLVDGTLVTAEQLDYETASSHSVRVRATDAVGAFVEHVFTVNVIDVVEGLLVDQVVTGRDGVTVSFDGPLDLPNLDLHNRAASPEDLDVTLVDAMGDLVDTALAVNAAGDGFRLVESNGLLTAGSYTLTIRSGEAGVVAADGRLLDGDGDGVGGGDFVSSFTVEPLPEGTAIVGVPGFFEDAGQEVSLPAVAGGGIPVIVTAPEGVMSLELEMFYNPALLEVTGVELAAGLPDGSLTLINVVTPGHAVVGFFSPQPLGGGSYTVARLLATVPTSATTDQTHVLDVSNVSLNEGLIPVVDNDGIHVVAVGNRAPTGINLSSNTVVENSPVGTVIGMLEAIDSDYGDSFTFELVAGEGDGDNASFSVDGRQLIAMTGFDFEAGATRGVRIRVTDSEGESIERAFTIQIENQVETLYVTGLVSATDGFGISFSKSIDVGVINLYDALDIYGESDLLLRGVTTGDVDGSLVIAADGRSLQFVANAPLALDTYSVIVRSGSDAFQTVTGELLDGNADEETGDSYNGTFTISEVPAVRLAVPSFARGSGQDVNVPVGSEEGIPLVLESDGTVRSLEAIFSFDPELLDVSAIEPAAELPEFVSFSTEVLEPGRIALRFDASESFPDGGGAPAGQLTIANVMAQVAATAGNGSSALISLESVVVNGTVTAGGSNAVQVVASLGDTSGDGEYSSSDANLAARLAMRLDSGLLSYPVINPSLVADVSGNGTVSMLDAAMIAGISSSNEGPELASAPPPRQMLLRHGGSFRIADTIDISGVLSDNQTSLLATSRDSASTRAQAFADIAAGWAASAAVREADTFSLADDSDESRDRIFADPGLV